MKEEQKIEKGILYDPADPELVAIKLRAHNWSVEYNQTYEDEKGKRLNILEKMLGAFGEGSFIQGPIAFHYGTHTTIGKRFFGNFNLTIQDDARVTIGDDCMFGPNVTLVTPLHPMHPKERRGLQKPDGKIAVMCYAKPIRIGNDCWLGAGVTVCPGVSIGDGCVIGAGSVVTRDIPPNCFAAGVPCRVIRGIDDDDSMNSHPEILAENRVISAQNGDLNIINYF